MEMDLLIGGNWLLMVSNGACYETHNVVDNDREMFGGSEE